MYLFILLFIPLYISTLSFLFFYRFALCGGTPVTPYPSVPTVFLQDCSADFPSCFNPVTTDHRSAFSHFMFRSVSV